MNLQLALRLITVPTLVGSVLTLGILAEQTLAADPGYTATLPVNQNACELPPSSKLQSSSQWHRGQVITVASADIGSGETAIVDFSEAESDAAAILFGCDCTTCINALRQLRNQSLLHSINSNPLNSTMMKGGINSKGLLDSVATSCIPSKDARSAAKFGSRGSQTNLLRSSAGAKEISEKTISLGKGRVCQSP